MENKRTMKSRLSGGSETTTYIDVEKFLWSKNVVRPNSINKKKTSYKKDAVEGIDSSGEGC